ncbi:MAG: hypothetical protein JWQ19_1606 [Subtercola sp.]|nr:hypothetical protein [Subtercola sp.]
MSEVTISTGDALAIRRLLWDIGAEAETRHDLMVEAYHWATVLDTLAGMPPWPTQKESTEEVISFFETVRGRLDDQISALNKTLD